MIVKYEKKIMVQCINLNCNNSVVNQMQLPLLCEKCGATPLVLVSLTVSRQSVEIPVDLKIFKILYQSHC